VTAARRLGHGGLLGEGSIIGKKKGPRSAVCGTEGWRLEASGARLATETRARGVEARDRAL
jgi:hypothetical protein